MTLRYMCLVQLPSSNDQSVEDTGAKPVNVQRCLAVYMTIFKMKIVNIVIAHCNRYSNRTVS